MTCKFKNICKEYEKDDTICKENGNWSYEKKAVLKNKHKKSSLNSNIRNWNKQHMDKVLEFK